MEDIDKNEVSDNGISEDEDLMMREVIQGDADLCYLHHLSLGSLPKRG